MISLILISHIFIIFFIKREKKGYLELDLLKQLMTSSGVAFRSKEMDGEIGRW